MIGSGAITRIRRSETMSLYSARTCSRRRAIAVADMSIASRLVVVIGSLEYCNVGEILRPSG
jgi:hypothetical protein